MADPGKGSAPATPQTDWKEWRHVSAQTGACRGTSGAQKRSHPVALPSARLSPCLRLPFGESSFSFPFLYIQLQEI